MNKKETIKWILEQFKAMGATKEQLQKEKAAMEADLNKIFCNLKLLD